MGGTPFFDRAVRAAKRRQTFNLGREPQVERYSYLIERRRRDRSRGHTEGGTFSLQVEKKCHPKIEIRSRPNALVVSIVGGDDRIGRDEQARAQPKLHPADKEGRRGGRIERQVGDVVARRAGLDEPVDSTDQGCVFPHPTHHERRCELERWILLPVLIRILDAPTKRVGLVTDNSLEGRTVGRPGKDLIVGI